MTPRQRRCSPPLPTPRPRPAGSRALTTRNPASTELDFRVGGRERATGGPPGGPVHTFDGRYQDIVPDVRFVMTYDMHLDDNRISVSLMTVELKPEGAGTRLTLTEQDAFLDGYDNPAERERGTRDLLEALDEELRLSAGPTEGHGKTRHD